MTNGRPGGGLLPAMSAVPPFAVGRSMGLLVLWGLITFGVLAAVVWSDLTYARIRLDQIGRGILQHVSDRALISEAAIEGFAAFVASQGNLDQGRTRQYAQALLQRYPFLYMFEVTRRVSQADRPAVRSALSKHYPGFQIRRFGYGKDRRWEISPPAAFFYPIVFQEPLLSGPDNVYGLDLYSSDFLRAAMAASFSRGEPVTTRPFDLAEGGRGYVMVRAVSRGSDAAGNAFDVPEYVLLALKSDKLFSALNEAPPGLDVRLWYRGIPSDDPAGEVFERPAGPVSRLAARMLPELHEQLPLELASQPFDIKLSWQLAWSDLSLGLMVAILSGSLAALLGVRFYGSRYIENELLDLEQQGRLYELANFDSLTGLANRNRLMDFLAAELARAKRCKQSLAVLFLDLDDFKEINDSYGHQTGDAILAQAARRLQRHLRAEELLARYGGDEFVWVTGEGVSREGVRVLISKLKAEFQKPVEGRGSYFQIRVSIGYAVFPQDGQTIPELFDAADADMYRDKRTSKAGRGEVSMPAEARNDVGAFDTGRPMPKPEG